MRRVGASLIGLLMGVPATSFAFAPPAYLGEHATLEVAQGAAARVQPRVGWATPKNRAAAWQRYIDETGASWSAYWDLDRGIPGRIYGQGVPAPGASRNGKLAERAARALLAAHLDLLAPGAAASDFELVSNHFDEAARLRSVGFTQHYRGVRVLGGQVSFRIKNDRIFVVGSEALPSVEATIDRVPATDLREKAAGWIAEDFGARVEARPSVEGPFVLPLIRTDGRITYHGVFQVIVDARDPIGRWSVWLDAEGRPVARKQTLNFAAGSLKYNAPERYPQSTRLDWPGRFVELTVDGQTLYTDTDGNFTWNGTDPADVTARLRGQEAVVQNGAGGAATVQFTLEDGQTFTWNEANDEQVDAQINAYVASNVVKDRTKIIAPNMQWLFNEPVAATVNLDDSCNAFSDGTTINFFRSSQQCENTGRIPDVVYHEFGHSFHAHAIIRGVGDFDTALSEGGADYLAATITDDPGMGRGFFYSNRALRHLDQAQGEATWPDDIAGDPHATGIIFGGAMWDLRKALVGSMGMEDGVAYTDQLLFAVFQRATDIPSSYAEVLAADDDDGDLSNGTPNLCAINEAFASHGLADPETVGPPLGLPERTGFNIHLPLGQRMIECPGEDILDATLEWRLRGQPDTGGTLTLGAVQDGFDGEIPAQEPGQVVEYRIEVTTEAGDMIAFPQNRAAPYYEMFVGEVVELFCSDFEDEAAVEGFSHELLAGEDREGADDWQWGIPAGVTGSGDPDHAFSGQRVYGNDLGGGNYNGRYQPNRQNVLHTPAIDVSGYENVRLQYRRWLNVEDAAYDQGEILNNGTVVWTNLNTGDGGNTHHEDREWRFHDVDLSDTVANGMVQIDFRITSDPGLEFGGWTIDDFCVVAFEENTPRCGDGNVDPGEACDDGNLAGGDGCEADCTATPKTPSCGDGVVDPGEACDDGNVADGDGCESTCTPTPVIDPNMCPGDPSCQQQGPEEAGGLTEEPQGGCGCNATAQGRSGPAGLLLLLGLWLVRRRRR